MSPNQNDESEDDVSRQTSSPERSVYIETAKNVTNFVSHTVKSKMKNITHVISSYFDSEKYVNERKIITSRNVIITLNFLLLIITSLICRIEATVNKRSSADTLNSRPRGSKDFQYQDRVNCETLFRHVVVTRVSRSQCICHVTYDNRTHMNCDEKWIDYEIFAGFFGPPMTVFTQRWSSLESLRSQMFRSPLVHLKRLDLSGNRLRQLPERAFDGLEASLKQLILSDNLLGDHLNPIFATAEFNGLKWIKMLDLSKNWLRQLDSNLFTGCDNLTTLNLESNELSSIPKASLSPLLSLTSLNLASNFIEKLDSSSFPSLPELHRLNLSSNELEEIGESSFSRLRQLRQLSLADNRLSTLPTSSLSGLNELEYLDLSCNLLNEIPSDSLVKLNRLRKLDLRSNKLISIDTVSFPSALANLEHLDLSRNQLMSLNGNTVFSKLISLRILDLSVNRLPWADLESSIGDLVNLEVIDLTDNELEKLPDCLRKLRKLRKIFADYNRIRELNGDYSELDEISLKYNQLTRASIENMSKLRLINVNGNRLSIIGEILKPIEENLLGIDLGYNELTIIPRLNSTQLIILNLSRNRFDSIENDDQFEQLKSLRSLYLSRSWIQVLPADMLTGNTALELLDLSKNQLETFDQKLFRRNVNLIKLLVSKNQLRDLPVGLFRELRKLVELDLGDNELTNLRQSVFGGLSNIRRLRLNGNRLASFRAEYFDSRSTLEHLDLSRNEISYIYPNAFIIHRNLRSLNLRNNKMTYFSGDLLRSNLRLESIDLAGNQLRILDGGDFAGHYSLKSVDLSNNLITTINGNVFNDSHVLYTIDLSVNRIERIDSKAFAGIDRLRLDLSFNRLTNLPEATFSVGNVRHLESLDLTGNGLTSVPSSALNGQHSNLYRLRCAQNRIEIIESNSNLLVNLKEFDISDNPLNQQSQRILLYEPSSMRKLNASNIGLKSIDNTIEAPFLHSLNISRNEIHNLRGDFFSKLTLLETFDISMNRLSAIDTIGDLLSRLQLRWLSLAGNLVQFLTRNDLNGLKRVRFLDLSQLQQLNHVECDFLGQLRQLRELHLYQYQQLKQLNLNECLVNFNSKLRQLSIEVKDISSIAQLPKFFTSQLSEIKLNGYNIPKLPVSIFVGLRSPKIKLNLAGLGLRSLPVGLFNTIPMSSSIEINIGNNFITSLDDNLLDYITSKQVHIDIIGFKDNQLRCDCNSISIYRYIERIRSQNITQYPISIGELEELRCFEPEMHAQSRFIELTSDQLVCQPVVDSVTTVATPPVVATPVVTPPPPPVPPSVVRKPLQSDKRPMIRNLVRPKVNEKRQTLTRIDTIIIGVATGIIAFVCILVLIICIVKLRSSNEVMSQPMSADFLDTQLHGIRRQPCTCIKSVHGCSCCYGQPGINGNHIAYSAIPRGQLGYYGGQTAPMRPIPVKMLPTSTIGRNYHKQGTYYLTYQDNGDSDGLK